MYIVVAEKNLSYPTVEATYAWDHLFVNIFSKERFVSGGKNQMGKIGLGAYAAGTGSPEQKNRDEA
jgi:hypothetical protein